MMKQPSAALMFGSNARSSRNSTRPTSKSGRCRRMARNIFDKLQNGPGESATCSIIRSSMPSEMAKRGR